jgi:hypothetical protein
VETLALFTGTATNTASTSVPTNVARVDLNAFTLMNIFASGPTNIVLSNIQSISPAFDPRPVFDSNIPAPGGLVFSDVRSSNATFQTLCAIGKTPTTIRFAQTSFAASATMVTSSDGSPIMDINGLPMFSIKLSGSPLLAQGQLAPPQLPAFIVAPTFGSPQGFSAPSIAVADVNSDNVPDVIVGLGAGYDSLITVIDGAQLFNRANPTNTLPASATIAQFFAFGQSFRGGTFVAAGDVLGQGRNEIIVGAGPGGAPTVGIFDYDASTANRAIFPLGGARTVGYFQAYNPAFQGGVRVAVANVQGNGQPADIITGAGPGGGPHVEVFSIPSTFGSDGLPNVIASFLAYSPFFTGGVFVAGGDYNNDGIADILTGPGFSGGPNLRVFNGAKLNEVQPDGELAQDALLADFMAFQNPTGIPTSSNFPSNSASTSGVNGVAFDDSLDADGLLDFVVGSGPGQPAEIQVITGTGNKNVNPNALLLDQFYGLNPDGSAFLHGAPTVATDLRGGVLVGGFPFVPFIP